MRQRDCSSSGTRVAIRTCGVLIAADHERWTGYSEVVSTLASEVGPAAARRARCPAERYRYRSLTLPAGASRTLRSGPRAAAVPVAAWRQVVALDHRYCGVVVFGVPTIQPEAPGRHLYGSSVSHPLEVKALLVPSRDRNIFGCPCRTPNGQPCTLSPSFGRSSALLTFRARNGVGSIRPQAVDHIRQQIECSNSSAGHHNEIVEARVGDLISEVR